MTIALGIVANGGLVIAADTQETVQGYWKRDQGKVRAAHHGDAGGHQTSCLIAAAGHAGYCDAIMERVIKRFLLKHDYGSADEIEAAIADVIKTFHMEHVVPFQSESLEVSAIIAAQANFHSGLWVSDKSAVTVCHHYTAVGIGASHALELLGRLWHVHLDVETTAILAAYVLYDVKEHVDGCGKATEVVYLRNNDFYSIPQPGIEYLEREFSGHLYELQPEIMRFAIGASAEKVSTISRLLKGQRSKLEKARQFLVQQSAAPPIKPQDVVSAFQPSV